jgi:hypothetical protein
MGSNPIGGTVLIAKLAKLAKLARRGSRREAAFFLTRSQPAEAESDKHHSFFKAWKKGLDSFVHLN